MSIENINDYLSSISALSTSMMQSSSVQSTASESSSDSDKDSYISTITDSSEPLTSDTYNDILQKIAQAFSSTSASNESSDTNTSSSTAQTSSSASGTSGSGSDSSDSSQSESEVVTINGVTYLQTTTTENGVETVTRKVIATNAAAFSDDLLSSMNDNTSKSLSSL